MFRIKRRRPSAALIVACCSLFVALSGTSYAVATGTVGSQEIRDGSIRDVDVANRALRGEKIVLDGLGGNAVKEQALDATKLGVVPQATAAETASRADVAAYAARTGRTDSAQSADRADAARIAEMATGLQLQVYISADGGRYNAHGVMNVDKIGTGRYIVTFDRDVTRCVGIATTTHEFDINAPANAAGTSQVSIQLWGPLGNDLQRRQVWVHTGSSAGVQADRGFNLLMSC